jgi:hypothetical protein
MRVRDLKSELQGGCLQLYVTHDYRVVAKLEECWVYTFLMLPCFQCQRSVSQPYRCLTGLYTLISNASQGGLVFLGLLIG